MDFDRIALSRATERVAKNGREWWLRWDVPAEVMVERLMLREIADRTKAVQAEIEAAAAEPDADATPEQAEALRDRMVAEWDAYRADVLDICHALFAHTYPEMSADEVAEHFNTNEQRAIIEYFFTLPTRRSSLPLSDGSAASPSMPTATQTSRATRRDTTTRRRR